ncbi:MAG: PVC-type heme-binding CxxCH protein, partial [Pirellulaceae bacterium]
MNPARTQQHRFRDRTYWSVLTVLIAVAAWTTCETCAQTIKPAPDATQPRTPEESLKCFRLPAGFRISIVASEPHLADPVAIDFDERGRIFVCEIHGYNLEGYLDIAELNKGGLLDRAVRRIPARPESIQQAEAQQYGTVKVLEDTDGDGRIDRSSVLADRLPPCYGVVAARGGVIVLCAPDIVYLADRDGDGAAEVRETLYTGFGVGELWTRISNPRWSLDNWIYGVSGVGSAGTITGPHLPKPVRIGSVCFRFKPDGSRIEPASGRSHGFGQAIDDWGDRFLCTNQQHALHVVPIPHRYLARNPFVASPNLTRNISSYGHPARLYPTSQPDPWRRERAADPAWVRFYGEAEATANGYFTAASGPTIYQDQTFPPAFRGNHFSVDNAQNLIHRCVLDPEGVSFTARRPSPQEQTEFLTSTEQWFRPVNLLTGPDGSLYVVDMYRAIIEDYSAIPRYLQQLYLESLIAGGNRGRIWRIEPVEAAPRDKVNLASLSSLQLADVLAHANSWRRLTAQRLLVERGDQTVASRLEQQVRDGATPQSRLHALYTLEGLSAIQPELLLTALGDAHFAVRSHALQLSERWLDRRPDLVARLADMVHDDHPRVQLQLALSLGNAKSPECTQALMTLAKRNGGDLWMQAAVLSSSTESASSLLASLLADPSTTLNAQSMIQALASIVGVRRDREGIHRAVAILAAQQDHPASALQHACLDGLIDGLGRGSEPPPQAPTMANDVGRLLTHPDVEISNKTVRLAGQLQLHRLPEMMTALAQAQRFAADAEQPLDQRLESIAILPAAPFDQWSDAADSLLNASHPLEIQLATVRALAMVEDASAAQSLLSNFASQTPRVRLEVMKAVFERQNRLPLLLNFLEQKIVPLSSLDAAQREQLLRSPVAEVAERAKRLLSAPGSTKDRQQLLEAYQSALELPRDANRGKEVFTKQCAKCHKLGGEGHEVGPDLLTTKTRADETLLTDVLDPTRQITVGYDQYSVVTTAGRIYTGVLAAETATSVTMRREEGAQDTILRRDIDEMQASSVSMMPENLEKELSHQDLADLLGFLRREFGPAGPTEIVLFDEDPSFVDLLHDGGGTVRVESGDAYSGVTSFAVTPLQRYSARIPNWQYRISEQPKLGEFRYLRFAWKQRSGEGAMLELAADGGWPPSDAAIRRYYCGRNTTGWSAVQVSETAAREWTLVTRDLWSDFGAFTLTGIAPTAIDGEVLFDKIELLRSRGRVGRVGRVESRESRVESRESRVQSPESRVESPESRVQSRESRVQREESEVTDEEVRELESEMCDS